MRSEASGPSPREWPRCPDDDAMTRLPPKWLRGRESSAGNLSSASPEDTDANLTGGHAGLTRMAAGLGFTEGYTNIDACAVAIRD